MQGVVSYSLARLELDQLLPQALPLCIDAVEEEVAQVVQFSLWDHQVLRQGCPLFCLCDFKLLSQAEDFLVAVGAQLIIIRLKIADYFGVGTPRRHQLLRVVLEDAVATSGLLLAG